jgi:predicted acylesterase/phospholipase RssA
MKYDIVFEGGGAKGMVFVGALAELTGRGHTFGRLLGTSAGAIAATFVAAGYTVPKMRAALSEIDADGRPVFATFMERPEPFTREEAESSATKAALDLIDVTALPNFIESRVDQLILGLMSRDPFVHFFSLLERGGWYAADRFMEWLRAKLDEGHSNGRRVRFSKMTFQEFYSATGVELSLVAADTTGHTLLVLNHVTAPQLPVVWGVRMSMSLPLVWEEVIWQPEWGPYMGREMAGHRIVDGGLLSNFPIELFISQDPYVIAMMGTSTSDGVLGLLIDETLPVAGSRMGSTLEGNVLDLTLPQRIKGLIDTATQAHDKMVIDNFQQIVCRLPAQGYDTTEFGMTAERREALIAAGQAAMAAYFDAQTLEFKGDDLEAMAQTMGHVDSLARGLLSR